MEKITKTQLIARLKSLPPGSHMEVYFCPSKMYPSPNHPFNMAIEFHLNGNDLELEYPNATNELKDLTRLQNKINHFEVYNCTNETGQYTHFYLV